MATKLLNREIDFLDLDDDVNLLLKNNNIMLIHDLCNLTRKGLKKIGMEDREIKQITIKLQLNGVDLNKKVY